MRPSSSTVGVNLLEDSLLLNPLLFYHLRMLRSPLLPLVQKTACVT
jgi:hypothetical protein